jgi:hypothetical protein
MYLSSKDFIKLLDMNGYMFDEVFEYKKQEVLAGEQA